MAARSDIAGAKFSMVEGGVCDGRTGWFALKSAANLFEDYEYWAYDSWEAMRSRELLPSELGQIGLYDYLELDQARANLREFGDRVRFCKGFVPDSLRKHDGPSLVHWLHIDLNAAVPTEAILSHFWDRIPNGGVVLLDDYNWPGHENMKVLVDKFLEFRNNWVISLPTGQGLIIKMA